MKTYTYTGKEIIRILNANKTATLWCEDLDGILQEEDRDEIIDGLFYDATYTLSFEGNNINFHA